MRNDLDSWRVYTSSDDILNFIVYIGCAYGLIDNNKYNGKEILWPHKSLSIDANSDNWEEWFLAIINLEVERIKLGKHPCTIIEEYMPPEFFNVKNQLLKECCKDAWPKFKEWWYMVAGGKNALNFIEGILNNNLNNYVNEVERRKSRKLKPFQLYINLLYTGLSKTIDINFNNNHNIIITSNPFGYFNEDWWIKKLSEIG